MTIEEIPENSLLSKKPQDFIDALRMGDLAEAVRIFDYVAAKYKSKDAVNMDFMMPRLIYELASTDVNSDDILLLETCYTLLIETGGMFSFYVASLYTPALISTKIKNNDELKAKIKSGEQQSSDFFDNSPLLADSSHDEMPANNGKVDSKIVLQCILSGVKSTELENQIEKPDIDSIIIQITKLQEKADNLNKKGYTENAKIINELALNTSVKLLDYVSGNIDKKAFTEQMIVILIGVKSAELENQIEELDIDSIIIQITKLQEKADNLNKKGYTENAKIINELAFNASVKLLDYVLGNIAEKVFAEQMAELINTARPKLKNQYGVLRALNYLLRICTFGHLGKTGTVKKIEDLSKSTIKYKSNVSDMRNLKKQEEYSVSTIPKPSGTTE